VSLASIGSSRLRDVLLKDHHADYITWDEFERNQRVIANNATGKGSATVQR
jgi:hypothetical protein